MHGRNDDFIILTTTLLLLIMAMAMYVAKMAEVAATAAASPILKP